MYSAQVLDSPLQFRIMLGYVMRLFLHALIYTRQMLKCLGLSV
jgi:hypothetical protein